MFDALQFSEDCRELDELRRERRALMAKGDEVNDRIVKKEALIEELIAGRLGLAEVTDRFIAISGGEDSYLYTLRTHFAGATDYERAANNVLGFVDQRVAGTGERRDVFGRLHREYAAMFGHKP